LFSTEKFQLQIGNYVVIDRRKFRTNVGGELTDHRFKKQMLYPLMYGGPSV